MKKKNKLFNQEVQKKTILSVKHVVVASCFGLFCFQKPPARNLYTTRCSKWALTVTHAHIRPGCEMDEVG